MYSLRFLILFWFLLAGAVRTGLVGPNRPSIEEEFGLTHGQFGLGIAVIQVLSAGLILAITSRLKRLNPMSVMIFGLALQLGGFGFVAATGDIYSLCIGWWLISAGTSLGAVGNNVSMDLWPQEPRKGVVLLHSFNAAGKVIGPVIAGLCLYLSWRMSFLGVGVVTLAGLAAFVLLYRKANRFYAQRHHEEIQKKLTRGVLHRPVFWLVVCFFAMIAGGEFIFATIMPTYFHNVRGFSKEQASWLLSLHLLGLMCGRFISAHFAGRRSNRAIVGICLLCGVAIVPILYSNSMVLLLPALFVLGGMFSSTWPSTYAHLNGPFAHYRAELAYGSALGNNLGFAVFAITSSYLADWSLEAAMLMGPIVLWLFGLLFFFGPLRSETRPIDAEPAAQ